MVACAADVTGINYNLHALDEFHRRFPKQPLISSESASVFSTRGKYKTDYDRHEIACYDEDCAAWGSTVRETWDFISRRPYVMGMFTWTGFDYRGEPTPFVWPSHSSFFGAMDTCGCAKDGFYLHQALWTESRPVLHLLPHWNFNNGETVHVAAYTNCEQVMLFLNERFLGKQSVDSRYQAHWQVLFEAGSLCAVGLWHGQEVRAERKTASAPASLRLIPEPPCFPADGLSAAMVHVEAVDEQGIRVPSADMPVYFAVEGAEILGVGNGDPNCPEPDKGNRRSLFGGYCQLIAGRAAKPGEVLVRAYADGLPEATAVLKAEPLAGESSVEDAEEIFLNQWDMTVGLFNHRPDPCQTREKSDMNTWAPVIIGEEPQAVFEGNTGKYALYRIAFHTPDDRAYRLHFYKLTGYAELYQNGQYLLNADCRWGNEWDVPLKPGCFAEDGRVELTLVLQSVLPDRTAGIYTGVGLVPVETL